MKLAKQLELLVCVVEFAPEDAEFYHFENKCYVKNIDQEHLEIAKSEPSQPYSIDFEFCETGDDWEANSGFLEYIKSLVGISEIKRRIPLVLNGDSEND